MEQTLADIIDSLASNTALSDIHIHADGSVYIRENGEIEATRYRAGEQDIISLIETYTSPAPASPLLSNNEADFALEIGNRRYRANLLKSSLGIGLILRLISAEIPQMDRLGLPQAAYDVLQAHDGLVLVTGQTGSGKSTTLSAMINHINQSRKCAIYTLEDPIEIRHHHQNSIVVQREIGIHTAGFAVGLKHILRQDPDIILLGEIRDYETIAAALTAAETGHLVFASLHTRNAADSINRIIDVFPQTQQAQAREQLAASLRLILSQRLLPAAGGGRVAAFEALVNIPAVAHLIREAKTAQLETVMQTNAAAGMVLMNNAVEKLISDGRVIPPSDR